MFRETLGNGIKVVALEAPGPVSRCGLIVNAGGRDEKDGQQGLAHFVEHGLFKGTTHRASHHILCRLDEVGGELNAYTTKDETAIHAAFLDEYFERATELIADMAFCSTFPQKELNKERDVITDEITSYMDNPAELIFDDFEDMAWAGTPMGHNILGTPESIRHYGQEEALQFVHTHWTTDQMVFVYIGPLEPKRIMRVVSKHLGCREATHRNTQRTPVSQMREFANVVEKGTSQAHIVLGCEAPSMHSDDRLNIGVLSNLLGGPCMNSRLSVALREKHGIAYNVETNYGSYEDTGLLSVYLGTDPQNIDKSIAIVFNEIDRLMQNAMSDSQFARAIRQYTGQLLMSADDGESLMLAAGRQVMHFDHVSTLFESVERVHECVSPQTLLDAAQRYLSPKGMRRLIYI